MTTELATPPNPAKLFSKLAEAMDAITTIAKTGHNNFHNYGYATEADVNAAIRKELSSRQIATFVGNRILETRPAKTSGGKDTILTDVEVSLTFACGETGAMHTVTGVGTGDDPSDKGTYKAITGGLKYLLLKTFLIATEDDPERPAAHQQPTGSGQADDLVIPFDMRSGTPKGTALVDASNEDLEYLAGRAIKDDKWKKKNEAFRDACKAIVAKRTAAAAAPAQGAATPVGEPLTDAQRVELHDALVTAGFSPEEAETNVATIVQRSYEKPGMFAKAMTAAHERAMQRQAAADDVDWPSADQVAAATSTPAA